MTRRGAVVFLALAAFAQEAKQPDGLYAEFRTSKGTIVARLETERTPVTVASFVGLAEGTIANAAFDAGKPYFNGTTFHRVVPGHVIQAGMPQSDRARNPGYTFPDEPHLRFSHNHAGVLGMANSGPHTNGSQFYITLADRSYLDADYTIFGEVVDGLDVVMRIAQGDTVETVRIVRVGAKAQALRPTTESFQAQLKVAQQNVAAHVEKKRQAEQAWVAEHYPKVETPPPASGPVRTLNVRYLCRTVQYVGHVTEWEGTPLIITSMGSDAKGLPSFDAPRYFSFEPGKTKINPELDAAIASMKQGERRVLIVPSDKGYGRAGYHPPEIAGQKRLVISPYTMLAYEIEAQLTPESPQ